MNAYYFKTETGTLVAVAAENEATALELVANAVQLVAVKPHTPVTYTHADYEAFCKALDIKPD